MSYRYICESCRQALSLPADAPYINRIRRESGAFSRSGTSSKPKLEVVKRDDTGKPFLVGTRSIEMSVVTPTGCCCACAANGHEGNVCTGERQFRVGGRPGSGMVDQLAGQLGREPIPELVISAHQGCETMVGYVLARWFGSTDEERAVLESVAIAGMRYDDQIKLLRDIVSEERPDLAAVPPYSELAINLRKLVRFRDMVAHSEPVAGDFFSRVKRERARNTSIQITPEQLAEYLDLSSALKSQLWFLPIYFEQPL